jgi:hypothetical protein
VLSIVPVPACWFLASMTKKRALCYNLFNHL